MKCQFTSDNGNGSALIDGTVGIYGKFSDLSFNFDTNHLEAASARVTFEGVILIPNRNSINNPIPVCDTFYGIVLRFQDS